jgi:hypothetical protein
MASTSSTNNTPQFQPLNSVYRIEASQCLNEADGHKLKDFLRDVTGATTLRSDADAQLLLSIPFNDNVRIQSLIIEGPAGRAPKSVKLFINNRTSEVGADVGNCNTPSSISCLLSLE